MNELLKIALVFAALVVFVILVVERLGPPRRD